jgi:hypothetical protein
MASVAQQNYSDSLDNMMAETQKAPQKARYQPFPISRISAPVSMYRPNGNFESLREQGIMRRKDSDGALKEANDAMRTKKNAKCHMPGYTGYIRGRQHIAGRTFGQMTQRAYSRDYQTHVETSPIPSGPQSNRHIPQKSVNHSFSAMDPNTMVPGYSGHVPGARFEFSKGFGRTTKAQREVFAQAHPRSAPKQRPGFATTVHTRHRHKLDSASLPGTNWEEVPEKWVPGNLEYLRFFAM